ncbi:hypothetical protein CK556_00865 [Mesoplasma chauliocola]|uniref:MOLPALP family lipoprotein n=1 Tax=Mesoplasma chauliocola TaxID=216427 RepID=A0A249SPR3_9MOLU|nr:hypothetical protein CK556_00865 [Mesoplasma chauliocola]
MKKLISLIAAASLSITPAMAVVSCKYVDTVQKSIDKKLAEVMSSTSNYFKGAILANSNGYNGQDADRYISTLKVSDLTPSSNDNTTMNNLFSTFLNTSQTNDYMQNDVYKRVEFDNPKEINPIGEKITLIQKAYNEVYKLVGVSFDPMLWNTALPLLLPSLKNENLESVQNIMPKILSSLEIMKDIKVPNYKQLTNMGIKTNRDLQLYFSSQLTLFIANLLGKDISEKDYFNFSDRHENIRQDFYTWNTEQFRKMFSKKEETSENTINFTSKSLALLFNALFGMNWYIQNFTTEEYNLKSDEMTDDNHVFSKTKTNLEIIEEVNSKNIEESIINATNVDGLLQFVYDLFSGEKDKESYKLLRTFKILFQVDNDITTGNHKLDFNTKLFKINEKTLSIDFGDWSTNGKTENGGLNTFFASTVNGILTGLSEGIDTDGGILEFLNSINMGSEQLSGIVSGLISSIMSGIDMTSFFTTFSKQLVASLENLKKWNSLLINESIKLKIDELKNKIAELEQKYKWIIKDGIITNKFLGWLVNSDIRTIVEFLGLEENLPIQLPKIALKQIINIQITSDIKLSDILTVGTQGVSFLISLLGKGIAPKIANIANSFEDIDLMKDKDLKIIEGTSTEVSLETLGVSKSLIKEGEGDKKWTYPFVLASKLINKDFSGINVTIPGGNKYGLTNTTKFSNLQAAKWIMGLGVEVSPGTIDWNQFRPGTILHSISLLWNDETGNLIKGVLGAINDILIELSNRFSKKNEQNYLEDLNYLFFSTKLISYVNFRDATKQSSLIYELRYKKSNINNKYEVKLILPATTEENKLVKYEIEYFKLIK